MFNLIVVSFPKIYISLLTRGIFFLTFYFSWYTEPQFAFSWYVEPQFAISWYVEPQFAMSWYVESQFSFSWYVEPQFAFSFLYDPAVNIKLQKINAGRLFKAKSVSWNTKQKQDAALQYHDRCSTPSEKPLLI